MSELEILDHERTFLVGKYICDKEATILCYSFQSILHEDMFDKNKGIDKILHTGTGLCYMNGDLVDLPQIKINYNDDIDGIETIPETIYIQNHAYHLSEDKTIEIQHFVRGKETSMCEKVENIVTLLFSLIAVGNEEKVENIINTLLNKDSGLKQRKTIIVELISIIDDKTQINILSTNLVVACMYLTGNYYNRDLKDIESKNIILKCFKILTSLK